MIEDEIRILEFLASCKGSEEDTDVFIYSRTSVATVESVQRRLRSMERRGLVRATRSFFRRTLWEITDHGRRTLAMEKMARTRGGGSK